MIFTRTPAYIFCYVDDLVEAFVRFMKTDDPIIRPMNLGNPGEFTIRELAKKVIELLAFFKTDL